MRRIEVPCTVDIEQTPESLHAHAVPEGVDIRPGDKVLVHGAPSQIGYGERVTLQCSATVIKATAFRPALDAVYRSAGIRGTVRSRI